jgi:hypothetical protein
MTFLVRRYVYRGTDYPDLMGGYFYAVCSARLCKKLKLCLAFFAHFDFALVCIATGLFKQKHVDG